MKTSTAVVALLGVAFSIILALTACRYYGPARDDGRQGRSAPGPDVD